MFLMFPSFRRQVRNGLGSVAALSFLLIGLGATSPAGADPVPQASPATASEPDPSPPAVPAAGALPSSSSAADTSPAGTQAGGPVAQVPATTATPRAAAPAFGHLPIIDIVPWYTYPQFWVKTDGKKGVDPLKNAGVGYDALDVGGTVKLPITPNISASFDRSVEGTLNVPNARVTTSKNAYQINTFSRDAVLVYRLDEQYHHFQIEEGLYFRHRIVGGTNTSDNPFPPTVSSTEAHYGYVGVTYTTSAIPWLLNSLVALNINADTQAIDHHVGCGTATVFTSGNFSAPCVNGVFDPNPSQNRVWETDQYVQLTVPIDRKHGVALSGQQRWGALNFYENAAFPYRATTSQTYFLTKRFNRVLAVSLRARSQWYVESGAPYVRPNAQHNGSIDLLADFKVDTNTLFH